MLPTPPQEVRSRPYQSSGANGEGPIARQATKKKEPTNSTCTVNPIILKKLRKFENSFQNLKMFSLFERRMTNNVSDSRSSTDEAKKKRRRKNSEERRSKEDERSEKNRTIVRTKTDGESEWSRATTDDESETKNDRAKTDERFGIWDWPDSGLMWFQIWIQFGVWGTKTAIK